MGKRKTYSVSTYDPGDTPEDDWAWTVRAKRLSGRAVVEAIRELRAEGYEDDTSIYVELD